MYSNIKTFEYDTIVVGGGMAGLYAAIGAKINNSDTRVALLVGGIHGASGCSPKTHGINASVNWNDSTDAHFSDTMQGGGYINDPELVRILVNEIPYRITQLEHWGVKFDRTNDGSYDVGKYGGSSTSRSIHAKDTTGRNIMDVLVQQITEQGVCVKAERVAVKLLVENGKCFGVVCLNLEENVVEVYRARSTVLATGGGLCVYPIATITKDKVASGMMMALEAGATLKDMEMTQFHPTGLVRPGQCGHGEIMEEELRTWGGILLDKNGKRFMHDYDSRDELATRDIVARSTYMEILKGNGTGNRGVILDISTIDRRHILQRFPLMVQRLRQYDVDLMRDQRIEISPTAHYIMGGIKIDSSCKSEIDGLFVCGEDAGGIDGGNRLGGNGVAGTLVFGYRAGVNASRYAGNEKADILSVALPYQLVNTFSVGQAMYNKADLSLKDEMWINGGLVRNGEGLTKANNFLFQLESSLSLYNHSVSIQSIMNVAEFVRGWHLKNKILLAKTIVASGLARTNSVGAHFRTDSIPDSTIYNIEVYLSSGHVESRISVPSLNKLITV